MSVLALCGPAWEGQGNQVAENTQLGMQGMQSIGDPM